MVTLLPQVITSLYRIVLDHDMVTWYSGATDESQVEHFLCDWYQNSKSSLPLTWQSLLDVLRRVDLEELSQQIEEHLTMCSESDRNIGYFCATVLRDFAIL